MPTSPPRILALAGGVGGAKLALGLARVLPPEALTVIVNTGDDETFHGLLVCPDLDTVLYTLSGLADPERGWGLADETFHALDSLRRYGEDTWFGLGDRDLATHLLRARLLREGRSLSDVTAELARRLGIQCALAPMSDQPVRTVVETDEGPLAFQEYFVKRRCEPAVRAVRYEGAEAAAMSPAFAYALAHADAIVYCPSNPILSIGPILAIPGAAQAIAAFQGPRIAVSPIVGDAALRGPAAKMLRELGEDPSCVSVAKRLAGIAGVLVIDTIDAGRRDEVQAAGLRPVVTGTVMATIADKERLAAEIVAMVQERRS